MPHQAAGRGAAACGIADGVAGGDVAAVAAGQAARVQTFGVGRPGGVGGDDGTAVVVAHQSAGVVGQARNRAAGVAGADGSLVEAGQAPHVPAAVGQRRPALHAGRDGAGRDHAARPVEPDQSAHVGIAGNRSGDVDVADLAVVHAGQGAHEGLA